MFSAYNNFTHHIHGTQFILFFFPHFYLKKGHTYFKCENNHGVLTIPSKVTTVPNSSRSGPRRRSSVKAALKKSRSRPRASSSSGDQDRLFLFSPKGDVDALSSEQLVLVLVSRGVDFDETISKDQLKQIVRETTPLASPTKALGLAKSKRKLLIMDINGLLVDRPLFIIRGQPDQGSVRRPFLAEFLNVIFNELNFDVTVWTAGFMSDTLREEMAMFRGYKLATEAQYQTECETVDLRSSTNNPEKSLFLKRLVNFWTRYPQYDEHNTVIIENDIEKVDCNRLENVICPAEWTRNVKDDNFLHPQGDFCNMLRQLAACPDVLEFSHTHQHLPAVSNLFALHKEAKMPITVRSPLIHGRTDHCLSSKQRMLSSMDRIVKEREEWISLTGMHFF